MLIVLSPAKSMNFDPHDQTSEYSLPMFQKEAAKVAGELRKLSPGQLGKLLNIGTKLTELNFKRYQEWKEDGNGDKTKQALLTFNGEVYNGLNAPDLSETDLDYAQEHLVILSGLYGILRPLDLIQPYRLEMSTKIRSGNSKDLYQYWNDKITSTVNESLKGHQQKILTNLASAEYFKSIDLKKIDGEVLDIAFKEKRGNSYRPVQIYLKKARGMMAHYIIKNRISEPEHVKGFDYEGYHFNESLSSGNDWVFTR
ncbi:MAG: peroxide stress protein YaaA [Bacteroidales bacterium]